MSSILRLLADLVGILEILIIVRIMITYFPQISPYNPGVALLRSIADPILAPFRRALPAVAGLDISPLLVIILLEALRGVLAMVANSIGVSPLHIALQIILQVVTSLILIVCVLMVLRVMVQLFQADPFHPLVLSIRQMTNPLLRPFSGVTTNQDAAPFIALIAYLMLYAVVSFALGSGLDRATL